MKTLRYWWLLWLGLVMVVIAITIVFMSSRPTTPRRVTVTMDTNGNARVGGIPLLTTNIRDGTFAAMGALGIRAALEVSTNPAQHSNLFETLQSMKRAGLFTTNQRPNPYE